MWEIPNLIILLLLLLLQLDISVATSQPICGVSGETFANNSTYEANLNTLIASLSSGGIGGRRFLNTSVGHSPDTVNAVVVCRGNISLPACLKCVSAAAPATAQRCPNWKEAIFWNKTCMFKYSHRPIFGLLNIQPLSHFPTKRILLQNTGDGPGSDSPPPPVTTSDTGSDSPPPPVTTSDTGSDSPPPPDTTSDTGSDSPDTTSDTGSDSPPPPVTNSNTGSDSNTTVIIVPVTTVPVVVSVCVYLVAFLLRRRKAKKNHTQDSTCANVEINTTSG